MSIEYKQEKLTCPDSDTIAKFLSAVHEHRNNEEMLALFGIQKEKAGNKYLRFSSTHTRELVHYQQADSGYRWRVMCDRFPADLALAHRPYGDQFWCLPGQKPCWVVRAVVAGVNLEELFTLTNYALACTLAKTVREEENNFSAVFVDPWNLYNQMVSR